MTTELTLSNITVTIPALGDSANIVTAFTDYHTDMAAAVAVLSRATNTFTGDIAINGGDATTTAPTFNLINTNATTVNFAGAGTGITIGASGSGTTTLRNTTVAMAGAATVGTTLAVTGNTTLTGDLAVNGGDLTTSAPTFNLLASPTTVNIAAAGTAVSIGASTGQTAILNDLVLAAAKTLIFEGATNDNFETTLTVTDPTADRTITLPNDSGNVVLDTTTQTLTNKTLTTPDINAGTADSLTSLSIRDTSAAYDVTLAATSSTTITAGRTLTLDLVNAARTLKLGANFTTLTNAVTLTGASGGSSVTLPTSGTLVNSAVATLSSLASIGTITTGTWNGSVVAGQYGGTGVANTGKTITVSGNTTIGSSTHTVALATSGNTSVTLPTSGTIEARPYRLFLASDVTDSISTSTNTNKTSAALGKYVTATTNTAYKVDFALHIYHSLVANTANGDAELIFRFALPSGTIKADFDYRLDTLAEDTASSVSSIYEEISLSSTDIIIIKSITSTTDSGYTVIRGSGIIRTGASGGSIGPTLYLSASNAGSTSSVSFTTAADSYCIIQPIGTTGEINTGEWA